MSQIIEKIEKLTKEIEAEKNFDRSIEKFMEAAGLIKQALVEGKEARGRVLEILHDLDEIIEKEMKDEDDN